MPTEPSTRRGMATHVVPTTASTGSACTKRGLDPRPPQRQTPAARLDLAARLGLAIQLGLAAHLNLAIQLGLAARLDPSTR